MLRLVYLAYRIYCFFLRPITVGVRVMMIRNNQVLLVRHTYQDGWFMPGGGVKRKETFEQAARREALEEVGAQLKNICLIGIYSNFAAWKSDHNIVFLANDFAVDPVHNREIVESRFFPLDSLPEKLWPGHRSRLEEYRTSLKPPQFGEW